VTALSDAHFQTARLADAPVEDDLSLYSRTRDATAFERVVRRHVDMVYTCCRRELHGDTSLADDATQAVFIVLSRKVLAGFVPPAPRLNGWLFCTARYCCDNLRRSQARRTRHERKAAQMRHETQDGSQSDTDTEIQIHHALGRLRDSERQVLLLRFFDRLSFREVGLALHISEAAAKFRANRALKRMGRLLTGRSATTLAGGALPVWLASNATAAAPEAVVTSAAATSLGQATPAAAAAANATVTAMVASSATKAAAAVIGSIVMAGGLAVGVAAILPATGPSTTPAAPTPGPVPAVKPATTPPATQASGVSIDLSTPEACLRSYVKAMRGGDLQGMERCLQFPPNELRPGELRGAMLIEFAACRLAMAFEQQFGGADKSLYRFPTLRGQFEALVDHALKKLPGPIVPNGNTAEVPMREEGDDLVSQDKVADIRWFGFWNKAVLHLACTKGDWKLDVGATLQAMSAITTRGFLKDLPYRPTLPVKEMAERAVGSKEEVARIISRAATDILNGTLTTQEEVNDRIHNDLVALFEKQEMLIPRYILMPKAR
jgi:RNA polymerase sigma factor (sigma-70 family)